jgi:hypothetical protein
MLFVVHNIGDKMKTIVVGKMMVVVVDVLIDGGWL